MQVVEWVATIKDAANKLKGKAGEFARVLHDHLPELTERYGVKSLGLFGSYVRGEETEGSDLDLLVEFAETPDLLEFVALGRDLSELLGVKVDLVMKASAETAHRRAHSGRGRRGMNRTPLDYFRDGLEAMQKAQEFVVFSQRREEQNGARIQGTIAPQEVVTIVVTVE